MCVCVRVWLRKCIYNVYLKYIYIYIGVSVCVVADVYIYNIWIKKKIYIYIYIYICMSACVVAYVHVYNVYLIIYMHIYIYIYLLIYMHIYIYIYIYMHVRVFAQVYIYNVYLSNIYICMHSCVCVCMVAYVYMYHHHHHVALVARISLTLSRHSSLSFIALGRSSGQHPVYSHSCWMYVRAGRPAFARPCVGVHKSTSLMSSSLLLQQCPACLVHLTWIVFLIGDRWPYSWCLVGCCRQDLFKIRHCSSSTTRWHAGSVPLYHLSRLRI